MSVWGKFLFLLLSLFDWWHDRFSDSVQFFTLHPTQGGAAPDPWGQIINSHLLFQSRNALYNKRGIAAKQKFQVFSINERHYCQFSVSPASAHHIYFRLVFRTIFVRNKNLKKLIIGNFTWAKTLFTLYCYTCACLYNGSEPCDGYLNNPFIFGEIACKIYRGKRSRNNLWSNTQMFPMLFSLWRKHSR